MNTKIRLSRRLLSIILSICLVMSYIPTLMATVGAAMPTEYDKWADASTIDDWTSFFPIGNNIDTENAGGVWTDKSVFTNGLTSSGYSMSVKNPNSLLVALSAIASNMTITGKTSVPSDTMLVLDVSGSMNDSNNNVVSELVTAANTSIKTLLESNDYSRVGVVLYNNTATVALPLGRYTTSDALGRFFNYNSGGSESISLNTSVVYEGTNQSPPRSSKTVTSGTYMQTGITLARDQFTAASNDTTINDPVHGVITRKPIFILMSDGAPTRAHTNFISPGSNSNLGDGTSSNSSIGFATQLSIAYAKAKIEEKYKDDALFYTLGLGFTSRMDGYNVARNVFNPINTYTDSTTNSFNTNWTRYNDAAVNDPVILSGTYNTTVTKSSVAIERSYVDKFFDASQYGTNLQTALIEAFKAVVDDIQLQTKYFPTLVGTTGEHSSGYVTFVDQIGSYMKVSDVKGITVGGTVDAEGETVSQPAFFSGIEMARSLYNGSLGTVTVPTDLGNEFVWAVMARLGIDSSDVARQLIDLAYQYGQLYYNEADGSYSNYIGWYADTTGGFLGFWHENIDPASAPAGAAFIMRSYGYLGAVNGHVKSDMMYATVQIRESMATGEQTVTFAIPASLVPVISYQVTLDDTMDIQGLVASGATEPMRLIYEVSLDPAINPYTVNEIVSEAYKNVADPAGGKTNINTDGSVNFYTNKYEVDNSTGFDPVSGQLKSNAYTYFRPSRQNDRYYYQKDSLVYTDANGTLYRGSTAPSGSDMYHACTVYTRSGNAYGEEVRYHKLRSETVDTAVRTDVNDPNSTWYIPTGDVRRDYTGFVVEKTANTTGTLGFSAAPFTDINGHNVNDTTHSFVVGATLGNNGKITVPAENGIKITKALAAGTPTTAKRFVFTVTNTANASDSTAYPAQIVNAAGAVTETTVTFANGKGSVLLSAGETVYIGGMTVGNTFTVKEEIDDEYKLQGVTVNGATSQNGAEMSVTLGEFQAISFTNEARGKGNLTLSKQVEHPFDAAYTKHTEKEFAFTVKLTLDGAALANRSYNNNTVQTNEKGEFQVKLVHNQQIEITGLPAGTVAAVVESNAGAGFLPPEYWDNGARGDGIVTVENNRTVSVITVNKYAPDPVYPVNIELYGTKALEGRDTWIDKDIYTFALERYDFATTEWIQVGDERTIKSDTQDHAFDFNSVFSAQDFKFSDAGVYYYRVKETVNGTPVPGVTYDSTFHSFAITVTDENMDGELEIKSVVPTDAATTAVIFENGVYKINTKFTNVYEAKSTAAIIEAVKTVDNPSGSPYAALNGFNFQIYKYDSATNTLGEAVLAAPAVTSVSGVARASITFTDEGIFHYAVKELAGADTKWTYSDTVVYVTVNVRDDGVGNLVATAWEGTADTAPDGASSSVTVGLTGGSKFTNTYKVTSTTLPLDFVFKALEGRAYAENEFSFMIEEYRLDTDGTLLKVEGSEILGKNGKPDTLGNSTVIFDKALSFDKVGTYYYNITEVSGNAAGVTYDKNVARVTVTVTDENGVLTAKYAVVNTENNTFTFKNIYTPAPTVLNIVGTKTLSGKALLNEEFSFSLVPCDAQGEPSVGIEPVIVKNRLGNKDNIVFPSIDAVEAGTYRYLVSELRSQARINEGIKFDTSLFIVEIVVTDNTESGRLEVGKATYKAMRLVGSEYITETADNMEFVNVYTPNPVTATIYGSKTLIGKIMTESDVFEFRLYEADQNWDKTPNTDPIIANNGINGLFEFEGIEFTEKGTYYFVIDEKQGSDADITYDVAEYHVIVEVEDDLRGTLTPKVYIFDGEDIPVDEISFINHYKSDPQIAVVRFGGMKTLLGRSLINGEFTFELYETPDDNFDITGAAPATVTNYAGGYAFEVLYDEDDIGKTFYYLIKEANAGKTVNGVSYDSAEYKITVTVFEDAENGLSYTVNVNDEMEISHERLNFTNVFKADVSVDIIADKTVVNKGTEEITPEGFKFILQNTDTNETVTALSDADGKVKFVLDYDEADIGKTYTYKLSEVNDGRENVEYSTEEYVFTVTVGYDSGVITAVLSQDNSAVDKITAEFVNEYDYTPPQTTETAEDTTETTETAEDTTETTEVTTEDTTDETTEETSETTEDTSDTTEEPPQTPDNPPTSDGSVLRYWCAILGIGCAGFVGIVRGRKKERITE